MENSEDIEAPILDLNVDNSENMPKNISVLNMENWQNVDTLSVHGYGHGSLNGDIEESYLPLPSNTIHYPKGVEAEASVHVETLDNRVPSDTQNKYIEGITTVAKPSEIKPSLRRFTRKDLLYWITISVLCLVIIILLCMHVIDSKQHLTGIGSWSSWSEWGPCSVTCGNGYRTRTRECNKPESADYWTHCEGETTKVEHCSERLCTVSECPADMVYGACMLADGEPRGWITWDDVEAGCQSPEGHHLNAQTNEKLQRLKSLIVKFTRGSESGAWIGGRKIGRGGKWALGHRGQDGKWEHGIDSAQRITFPDHSTTWDCLEAPNSPSVFHATPCDGRKIYICEEGNT